MNHGQIVTLSNYPIKGLSANNLSSVEIFRGNGFPNDRMFAFAKANSGFVPSDPKPMPKDHFIVLMQYAKLAGLQTSFDPDQQQLTVQEGSQPPVTYEMSDKEDRVRVRELLNELLKLPEEEYPFFATASPHRFTDVSVVSEKMMNAISLLNLASLRAFGDAISQPVDPRRFRANIVFDGWPPFSELDLVGRIVQIGGLQFRVLKRTQRCAATEVNPDTSDRDIRVPYLLRKTYGHMDMGVYAEALESGVLNIGDRVEQTKQD